MKRRGDDPESDPTLRRRAEGLPTERQGEMQAMTGKDPLALLHELQTHQIELEMQNEELRRAHQESEELRLRCQDFYDFAPVGYFTLEEKGLILDANLAGALLVGVERSLLIGLPFSTFIAADFQTVFTGLSRRFLGGGSRERCEVMLRGKGPEGVWVILEGLAVAGDAESRRLWRVALTEITECKQTEEALNRLNAELERRVQERTIELAAKNAELERMNRIFVGRELRMVELKERIKKLEKRQA